MSRREPRTTRLPSTTEIMQAPERAVLAALDANLELTIRSLKAAHVALGPSGRLSTDPDYEPYVYDLLPIAETLVVTSRHLRRLVAEYQTVATRLLATPYDGVLVPPAQDNDLAVDDEIHF